MLVEFENPTLNPAKRYFGLLHRLEDTWDCEVDLLTISGIRSPDFRRQVLKEKITFYEEW